MVHFFASSKKSPLSDVVEFPVGSLSVEGGFLWHCKKGELDEVVALTAGATAAAAALVATAVATVGTVAAAIAGTGAGADGAIVTAACDDTKAAGSTVVTVEAAAAATAFSRC